MTPRKRKTLRERASEWVAKWVRPPETLHLMQTAYEAGYRAAMRDVKANTVQCPNWDCGQTIMEKSR